MLAAAFTTVLKCLASIARIIAQRFGLSLNWPHTETPTLGRRGERAAARFLRGLGYRIIGEGVRDNLGELDLIAVDWRTVVYVEVKTRRSGEFERPAEAVDRRKRYRICRAAAAYAKRHQIEDYPTRFDIMEVVWPDDLQPPRINHLQAAFESELTD